MTFVHFINCMALSYGPYMLTYKASVLSEYNALFKVLTAGMIYMITQLAKMMVLATFFPSLDSETSNFLNDFLKTTVDLADIAGIYFIINRTVGKPELKILSAGIGWAGAQVLFSNLFSFWFGARSQEFDWTYIHQAIDSNITLVHVIAMVSLIWIWTRTDLNQSLLPLVSIGLFLSVFRDLLVQLLINFLSQGAWAELLWKSLATFLLSCFSIQLYANFAVTD